MPKTQRPISYHRQLRGTLATMAAFIVTFIDDLDLDVDGAQTEDGADGMVGTIFTMENR